MISIIALNQTKKRQTITFLLSPILCAVTLFFGIQPEKGLAEEKTYVTCMLWGELGNQMFEIANTLSYALDNCCEPIFSGFSSDARRDVNLRYVFHRLNVIPKNSTIQFEDYHHSEHYKYAPILYKEGKNLRFMGYYQNERYFLKHKDYIKKIFSPSEEVLARIKHKYGSLDCLFKTPVVGVHIRTFLTSARHPNIDGFGGATWEYFIDAMNLFPQHYTFFIFSDCPEWVESNLPCGRRNVKFIKGNPHYIDFYLLSLCHHQVISPESTFSWWAAWLNSNPNKLVIAPHFWQQGYTGEDAFPSDWIRIFARNKFGY